MIGTLFNRWNDKLPTFGNLAFAAFLVAVVSGIPLAIPFDINHASDSLELLSLANPAALFFRGLHYWSGQLFVLTMVFHVIEHLARNGEKGTRSAVWIKLVLALPVGLFVMITGFILKSDIEGDMARQILSGLLNTLPVIGSKSGYFFLGSTDDLQLVYLHHLVTASIFLLLVIFEHVRRAWPDLLSFVYLMGIGSVLAVWFPPEPRLDTVSAIKGPWYLIGLQEMLHWIPYPLLVIGIVVLSLVLLGLVKWLSPPRARLAKRVLAGILFLYILLSLNNWFLRDAFWNLTVG